VLDRLASIVKQRVLLLRNSLEAKRDPLLTRPLTFGFPRWIMADAR
jgi:hypothetical protein